MTNVKDIAFGHLHVRHLELRDTVYDDVSSVVFLATRFSIEVCPIEDNTEGRVF